STPTGATGSPPSTTSSGSSARRASTPSRRSRTTSCWPTSASTSSACPGRTSPTGLRPVLLIERANRVDVDPDPEARRDRLEQGAAERVLASYDLLQLRESDWRPADPFGENGDARGCRHPVGQQPVTLVDDIVVVRD